MREAVIVEAVRTPLGRGNQRNGDLRDVHPVLLAAHVLREVTARAKLGLQILTSLLIAVALIAMQKRGLYSTKLIVPFIKQFRPDLVIERWAHNPHLWPLAFFPFVIFVCIVIVGSSNAVNLTDGLDGLAIGCTVIAAGALTVLTYVSGHATFASYLELQRMPQIGELTIFCGAMVGASSFTKTRTAGESCV